MVCLLSELPLAGNIIIFRSLVSISMGEFKAVCEEFGWVGVIVVYFPI